MFKYNELFFQRNSPSYNLNLFFGDLATTTTGVPSFPFLTAYLSLFFRNALVITFRRLIGVLITDRDEIMRLVLLWVRDQQFKWFLKITKTILISITSTCMFENYFTGRRRSWTGNCRRVWSTSPSLAEFISLLVKHKKELTKLKIRIFIIEKLTNGHKVHTILNYR